MTQTVTEAIYKMSVAGKDGVDAAARSVDGLAVSEEKLTRATRASEQGFDRLMGKLDPAIRAHQQYERTLEQVARYEAAGIGTQEQRAQAVALATQRYQQAVGVLGSARVANDNLSKSTGLAAHQMQNLGFQLNDVATMLASGASPLQVLATQGGQVYQVLSSGPGGVGGALKDLAGRVVAFLGPLALLAAGFAAVSAAAFAFFALTRKEAPTAEALLEEHDRLLNVVKSSYDKATGAAKNFYEQSREVTQLQLLQQEIDLRERLTAATIKGLRATVEIPIGGSIARIKDEYQAFADAIYTLNEAWQQGTPNVQAFQQEVAKIALANPALRQLANDLVNSLGDASKLSAALERTQDMLKLLQGGKLSQDERGGLGLSSGGSSVNAYDQLIQRTKDRIEQLELEAKTAGQTGAAVMQLRLQHEAELAARKAGVPVNQQEIDLLKERLALAERAKRLGDIRASIEFDRATIGLSQDDVQIAQQLRGIYPDVAEALNSVEAGEIRLNNALRETQNIAGEAMKGFLQDLRAGKTEAEAFANMLDRVIDRLLNSAIDQGIGGITGRGTNLLTSLIGGGGGGSPVTMFGGAGANFPVPTFHGGGIGGATAATRYVDPSHFDRAPRYHSGIDYAGGEMPAVIMRGEEVGWPADLARKYGGGPTVKVTVNNYGNDNVDVQQRSDGNGGVDLTVIVDRVTAKNARTPGTATANAIGARPALIRR